MLILYREWLTRPTKTANGATALARMAQRPKIRHKPPPCAALSSIGNNASGARFGRITTATPESTPAAAAPFNRAVSAVSNATIQNIATGMSLIVASDHSRTTGLAATSTAPETAVISPNTLRPSIHVNSTSRAPHTGTT